MFILCHRLERKFRTPKVNVCCAISRNRPKGLFFFRRKLIDNVYQQMIQNWLYDELIANEQEHFIFKQDGTPPHWQMTVQTYLSENLLIRWIGRTSDNDNVLLKRKQCSPDLTPCDFFIGLCESACVYQPSFYKLGGT